MARGLGVLHIDVVGERLAFLQIANDELLDGERVTAAVGAHDVECGLVNAKLLDGSGWAAKVRAASGGKVPVVGGASQCWDDDVEAGDVNQAHALAQHQQVEPGSLKHNAARSAQRGKAGGGLANERDISGHEAGVGKIDAVVMPDFYFAGEDLLEHGLDFSVPVRPIRGDEDNDCCHQDGDGRGNTAGSHTYFASPEPGFVRRLGSSGRDGSRCRAFHEMEIPAKTIFGASR